MIVYNFIVIDAPNREGAPDCPDCMYSGKLFPTGLLNIYQKKLLSKMFLPHTWKSMCLPEIPKSMFQRK